MAISVTMAVSAPTSSLHLLPSFEGLRAPRRASVKALAVPADSSIHRPLIVAVQEPIASTTTSSPPPASSSTSKSGGVTIEYQRQRAKEMQEYFKDKKYDEEIFKSRLFGWTRKNEVTNGRWTMFGIAVGLLTEYATGSDFIEQLKIIVSNLGIAEVD